MSRSGPYTARIQDKSYSFEGLLYHETKKCSSVSNFAVFRGTESERLVTSVSLPVYLKGIF